MIQPASEPSTMCVNRASRFATSSTRTTLHIHKQRTPPFKSSLTANGSWTVAPSRGHRRNYAQPEHERARTQHARSAATCTQRSRQRNTGRKKKSMTQAPRLYNTLVLGNSGSTDSKKGKYRHCFPHSTDKLPYLTHCPQPCPKLPFTGRF